MNIYQDMQGWWFRWHGDTLGPYETKREALEDLRGLLRTERGIARYGREFVTTEQEQPQCQ